MTFAELCQQAHGLSVSLGGRHVSVTLDYNASERWDTKEVEGQYEIGVYIAKYGACAGLCERVKTVSQASALLGAFCPVENESVEIGEIAEQIA